MHLSKKGSCEREQNSVLSQLPKSHTRKTQILVYNISISSCFIYLFLNWEKVFDSRMDTIYKVPALCQALGWVLRHIFSDNNFIKEKEG